MPTYGERALSKVQWGLEGTPGSAVAADTMVLGAAINGVPQDRNPVFPTDALGVRAESSRALIYQYLAEAPLEVEHCYYQLLPMIFSCGVKGSISPAEQTGSEGDYLWAFTPSLTAANSPESITLEVGDNAQAYEIEYVMFERIRLAASIAQGADASPVSLTADYFGRQVTPTTFTGALSAPTAETINAKLSRIYIDSTFANAGNTEVASLLRGWELEIITGIHPKFFGSANKYFDVAGEGYIAVMLALTFEGSSDADTEFDKFQLGTEQAIRIEVQGSQIGAGDNHTLSIDIWGAYEGFVPMSEEDRGNNISAATWHGLYDGTAADMIDVNVTTDLAAI